MKADDNIAPEAELNEVSFAPDADINRQNRKRKSMQLKIDIPGAASKRAFLLN